MKKILLLAVTALWGISAFAQTPDVSAWKIGEDVSEAVGFGNLNFENDPVDYWKYTTATGNTTATGGLFEIYDGENCDLYQYLYLPAGMYELNCQGYYRSGSSWDTDPNSYANGTWKNYTELYASVGTYDIDSEEFVESGSKFANPLMPRLFEQVMERYYTMPEGEAGWDMSDGQYDQCGGCFGPTSIPGSLIWFENGQYMPYESDEDETVYNKVIFFITEDSWVKVGVSKTTRRELDSFMATNFHLLYMGTADEAAKVALALKSMEIAQRKVEMLSEEIILYYPALGILLQDEIMDLDYDNTTVEGVETATAAFSELFEIYTNYFNDAKSLTAAIESAEELIETTDFSGKPAFLSAIEAASVVATAEDPTSLEGPEDYTNAYNALNDARGIYVKTQEATEGVYNYSNLINQPFFCNNEYTPTWNEDIQQYVFNDEIENTWATVQEQAYSELIESNADWIPLCSNVEIATSGSDEGRWVINSTTWHGGGPIGVTMQHSYPAIGGWTAEPSNNPERIHQTITNLPNGFYSMGALMCNAGADISPLMYVYIENSEGTQETAPLTQKGNPWWGGNKDAWRQTVWEKLETGMIQVTDGRVTIGASSDFFYAVTGFQLYYYGETPDFTSMVQKKIDAVTAAADEQLTFPGDFTYINNLLAQIQVPVTSFEAFDAANKATDAALEYISSAYNYLNNWRLDQQIIDVQDQYDVSSAEYQILDIMFNNMQEIGTRDEDTYKTAQEASDLFNKFSTYLNYRNKVAEYAAYYEKINEIIAAQNEGLLEGVTDEKLEAYTAELEAAEAIGVAADIHVILEPLGIDNATPENPVDVSVLIKNPTYDEGSTGWDGGITVDNNLHNAERFNTTFDVSQTIKALPAGCYLVKVQSYYRDGGSAGSPESGVYYNWNIAAGEDMEWWETKHVQLYARTGDSERISYVQSLASTHYTEPSTDKIFQSVDDSNVEQQIDPATGEGLVDENGDPIWTDPDTLWYTYDDAEITWQLDQRVYIIDEETSDTTAVYYYPNSMTGADARFTKSPEAYQNEVAIMVEEGGTLTFGLRKTESISNDWCMFDNWKLYYLGKDAPSGIASVTENVKTAKGIYNLAGLRLSKLQKGLNIVDGKKILIK